jgi:membrane protein implicated in regulation of membrane protease activity
MEILIPAFFLGLIPGFIAYNKGRSFLTWYIYGVLLFIVALIHSIVIKSIIGHKDKEILEAGMKKCPFCAEMIKPDAKVCRYCGKDFNYKV